MEQYKPIKDFEDYEISNLGNVKSNKTNKILKPCYSPKGYQTVNLQKDKKAYSKQIHRLVAEAFIQNPENKPIVDHINNKRDDNRVANLRWASSAENSWNRTSKNPLGKGIYQYHDIERDIPIYNAKLYHKGTEYDLGRFDTLEEAQQARYELAQELFGDFINECEKPKINLTLNIPKSVDLNITVNVKDDADDAEYRRLEKEFEELLKQ